MERRQWWRIQLSASVHYRLYFLSYWPWSKKLQGQSLSTLYSWLEWNVNESVHWMLKRRPAFSAQSDCCGMLSVLAAGHAVSASQRAPLTAERVGVDAESLFFLHKECQQPGEGRVNEWTNEWRNSAGWGVVKVWVGGMSDARRYNPWLRVGRPALPHEPRMRCIWFQGTAAQFCLSSRAFWLAWHAWEDREDWLFQSRTWPAVSWADC